MAIQYQILFKTMPRIEEVCEMLNLITGLSINYEGNNQGRVNVRAEGMNKIEIFFDFDNLVVEVLTFTSFNHYLFVSAVYTLLKLGVEQELKKNKLPHWAGKKWKDIKWWNFTFR